MIRSLIAIFFLPARGAHRSFTIPH